MKSAFIFVFAFLRQAKTKLSHCIIGLKVWIFISLAQFLLTKQSNKKNKILGFWNETQMKAKVPLVQRDGLDDEEEEVVAVAVVVVDEYWTRLRLESLNEQWLWAWKKLEESA